jgi:holin-like protein
MSPRKLILAGRRAVRGSRLSQIVLVLGFWLLGNAVARLSGLPIPGGIIGMLIVLALLASRRLSHASLRQGANWFIAEMLLFFVPAVLAVMDHREFIGLLGLKILSVILLGTLVVMAVTALVVDLGYRLLEAQGDAVE